MLVAVRRLKTEHVLVEVGLEVLGPDGAMVGTEEPALGEAEEEVDAGQAQAGVAPRRTEVDGLVVVAPAGQVAVAGAAVGGDGHRLGGVGVEETLDRARRCQRA